MVHLEAELDEMNVENELSVQNYTKNTTSVVTPFWYMRDRERSASVPAGRTPRADFHSNRQPKGCNNDRSNFFVSIFDFTTFSFNLSIRIN